MSTDEDIMIAESYTKDSGLSYGRLDPILMEKFNLEPCDIVELSNLDFRADDIAFTTAVKLMEPLEDDRGSGIIRIDAQTRKNINSKIGDKVSITKIHVQNAESVRLVAVSKQIRLNRPDIIGQLLKNRLLIKANIINIPTVGGMIQIYIKSIDGTNKYALSNSETQYEFVESEIPETDMVKANIISYEDIGGMDAAIKKVREMVELPIRYPQLFSRLGIKAPKGVLLYGPPGTGKTLLARVVANETDSNFITISGPEILNSYYGKTEENLRKIFEEAQKKAPSIIFIDEIDSIAPKRDKVGSEADSRLVAQLLALMDGLSDRGEVVVIGATNRVNSIDEALRRPGRFDREIEVGVPDVAGRKRILEIHTKNTPLDGVDLEAYSQKTHGYVGADLNALCREAGMTRISRLFDSGANTMVDLENLTNLKVHDVDFEEAIKSIHPSALREYAIDRPKETWADVGGLEKTKEKLKQLVEWPIKYPNLMKRLKIKTSKGILLMGFPGTGKTLLAKALANESKCNFISVKGPEFLSMWYGESEKAVRELFKKARAAAPCVIFFDEIDSITPHRGGDAGGGQHMDRLISQLLTEIDGLEELAGVMILAATNRPDMIDAAMLRPGRLGEHITIDPPEKIEDKIQILNIHLKGTPVDQKDLVKFLNNEHTKKFIGDHCTPADLESLAQGAKRQGMIRLIAELESGSISEDDIENVSLNLKDFLTAVQEYNILRDVANQFVKNRKEEEKKKNEENRLYT